jgi:D-alanine--poly(phosphoribitol) ligase subunit 1
LIFEDQIIYPILNAIRLYSAKNAFCINNVYYTYADFACCISKIRKNLSDKLLDNNNVGLVVNDDIDTYASIFAIWLEGLAYVPLHPNQPIERGFEIIKQAYVDLIIDSSPKPLFDGINVIESNKLAFERFFLEPKLALSDSLAYILFTSGSTGKPKGVTITRGNVGSFMKAFWEIGILIDNNDRCLQCFDLTFDVSVQSFLVPLTTGACTYTVPNDQIKYSYVYGLLEDHRLTFGAMAPSLIRYLRPYFDEINFPAMRYNIVTAEASPVDLIQEWSKCIPNADIFDFYGPTEVTIYCTYYKFMRDGYNKQLNGMLSIGKPMSGLNTIVVDDYLNIVSSNQRGELCISGDQLTPGYWMNSEKNRESFFEIDYRGVVTRFYKTGDYCYYDEQGDIILVGRLDYQVKIHGFRIELGEIEYHARDFLKGQNAIAIAFTNQIGNSEIALFIEGPINDKKSLVEYLNCKMPSYMVPTRIINEYHFELNTSGKVDRIKLKKRLQSD